ncbi:MAG TPA: ATP-grasp domain-containing protein [Bacteroidales bacterium]|nr:ATP-grasp domain-containing protein [Bacteroidales bacterium]HPS74242.1 ATP-grasp domain-containing protein [Bacteroidales bacterium]
MSKTILIIHNDLSDQATTDELDVLEQVSLVKKALIELGYAVQVLPVSFNLEKTIREIGEIKPYAVFNLVETLYNRSEFSFVAPSLLGYLNVPFTGSPLVPMFLASNKMMTKDELTRHHIRTPGWFPLTDIRRTEYNKKYILKPVWEEGSLGLDEDNVFCGSETEKIERFAKLNPRYFFVEEFIEGREFNISIIGDHNRPQVLPLAEMTFLDYPEGKPRIMGYSAKWNEESFEYSHTRRTFAIRDRNRPHIQQLTEICEQCWNAFGLRGYVRVDFRLDRDNTAYVIDINANPCLSASGGFVAASKKAGMTFREAIDRIVAEAVYDHQLYNGKTS